MALTQFEVCSRLLQIEPFLKVGSQNYTDIRSTKLATGGNG